MREWGFVFAVAVGCLQSSWALAADVVTLRCDFPDEAAGPAIFDEIIADQSGISVTNYIKNKKTGELHYTKAYTTNEKNGLVAILSG